jgi:hypothetical protein
VEQATGQWWRYSRYEVRRGYIRPVAGAALEPYDPWSGYWAACENPDVVPPYIQLVRLAQDVPSSAPWDEIQVPDDVVEDLLAWCRSYGLLGLLPHTVMSARLGECVATRTPSGWETSGWWYEPDAEPFGEIVVEDIGAAPTLAFEDHWYEYFPDVPKDQWMSRRPLVPSSEEFWQDYGEPAGHVLGMARFLADALDVLARREAIHVGPLDVLSVGGAVERLNGLAVVANRLLSVGDPGMMDPMWQSPSLLGHLARQASQDLNGERRLLACGCCGRVFHAAHPARRFCSNACRNRQHRREHRARRGQAAG